MISDTHLRHSELNLSAGDLLIHCGDMFNLFEDAPQHLRQMDEWFGQQPFDRILCVGGNHDRPLQTPLAQGLQPFRFAQCVTDELVEYRGLKIYGSPWVPALRSHAFYRDRSSLAAAWSNIPADIDILITHTPPHGVLDRSSRGRSLGCHDLAEELKRISPRVHCFGHVHASSGQLRHGETLFINAASIDSTRGAMRRPSSFTIAPGAAARTNALFRMWGVRSRLSNLAR